MSERSSRFTTACGIADGNDLCSANDTPALNALKALRGAPISMGRGETPVGCCQQPSGFAIFTIYIVRQQMQKVRLRQFLHLLFVEKSICKRQMPEREVKNVRK